MKKILKSLSMGLLVIAPVVTVSCAKHDITLDEESKKSLIDENGALDSEQLLQGVANSSSFVDAVTKLFTDDMWKKNTEDQGEFEEFKLYFDIESAFSDGDVSFTLMSESSTLGELSNVEMKVIHSTYDENITSAIESELIGVANNISDTYANVANLVLSTNAGIKEAISISQESKNNNSIEYLYSNFEGKAIHYKNVDESFTWLPGGASTFEGADLQLNLVNSHSSIYDNFRMEDNIEWASTRFSWGAYHENDTNILFLHFLVDKSIEITVDIDLIPLDEGLADAMNFFNGIELDSTLTSSELIEANTSDENLTLTEIVEFENNLGLTGAPFSSVGGYLDLFIDWDVRFINVKYVFQNNQLVGHRIYFYITDEIDLIPFYMVLNPSDGGTNV